MKNTNRAYRYQIITFLMISVFLICSLATLAQKKQSDMNYLIEGVDKIYITDESRCSDPALKSEVGKVYIIEGTEKLDKIRKIIDAWKLNDEYGGCACGGPDKHYYCFCKGKAKSYWGLDCDTYLNGRELPMELNALINPKYDTFLGVETGYALIADVSVEVPEDNLIKKADEKSIKVLYNLWERENILNRQKQNTAPFEVTLRVAVDTGDLHDPEDLIDDNGNSRQPNFEENRKYMIFFDKVDKLFQAFIEHERLNKILLAEDKKDVDFSWNSKSAIATKRLFLASLPQEMKQNAAYQLGKNKISIQEVRSRTDVEKKEEYFYQVTILVPTANSEEEAKRVASAIPMLKNVKCICDRFPF